MGAAHLPAAFTIPLAVVVALIILGYWRRLGTPEVPQSRRRIRRASLAVILAALPVTVAALSFADAPNPYVVTWVLVMLCVGLVLITAALDLANTARLSRETRRQRFLEAAADAARSARAGSEGTGR